MLAPTRPGGASTFLRAFMASACRRTAAPTQALLAATLEIRASSSARATVSGAIARLLALDDPDARKAPRGAGLRQGKFTSDWNFPNQAYAAFLRRTGRTPTSCRSTSPPRIRGGRRSAPCSPADVAGGRLPLGPHELGVKDRPTASR